MDHEQQDYKHETKFQKKERMYLGLTQIVTNICEIILFMEVLIGLFLREDQRKNKFLGF